MSETNKEIELQKETESFDEVVAEEDKDLIELFSNINYSFWTI